MEIKQLRYFLAVAEELSFSRAAERLNMSQPPLSLQIQKLEEELGVFLFIRGNRKIALTASGEAMLVSARRLIEAERRIADDVRKAAMGDGGRLIVGTTDDFFYDDVPRALAELHRRHRNLVVETTLNLSFDIVRAVAQRRLDIGFVCPPVNNWQSVVAFRELSPSPIQVLLPQDHRLAQRENVSLEEIWSEPFIWHSITEQTGFVLQLSKIVRKMNGFPEIVHRTPNSELTKLMVKLGVGVALVTEYSVGEDPELVRIPIEGLEVKRAAVWRDDNPSELISELVDLIAGQHHEERS